MTNPHLPPAPDQHDTTVLARPLPPDLYASGGPGHPGAFGPGPGQPGWQTPGVPLQPNPRAARYRRQRTVLGIVVGLMVAVLVGVVGLGVAAWQFVRSNPLLSSASELADGLGRGADGQLPEGLRPEGLLPEGLLPEGTLPEGLDDLGSLFPEGTEGLDGLVPEDLGGALGSTDVEALLDQMVANGWMSEKDADALLRALDAAGALGGLAEPQQQ